MSHQEDTDAFFERLVSRPLNDGSTPHPGITALRDALRAQIETMRSAETTTEADLDPEERARMAEIKQQLLDRGFLVAPVASTPSRLMNRPSLLQRAGRALLGRGWQRPAAVASLLLAVLVIVVKIALPPAQEETIIRGTTTPVIVAPDPAAVAESLAEQLRTTGAEVLIVQINAKEWSLRIDVPRSGNLSAAQKILRDAGIPVVGPPPYGVRVKSES